MSRKRKLWLVAVGSILLEGVAWYATRKPDQRGYLRSVARQLPHMPGRYVV